MGTIRNHSDGRLWGLRLGWYQQRCQGWILDLFYPEIPPQARDTKELKARTQTDKYVYSRLIAAIFTIGKR